MLRYLERQREESALEILARAAGFPGVPARTAKLLFGSYDRFLAILDDEAKRKELEDVTYDGLKVSPVWEEIRNLSHDFQTGLTALFFDDHEDFRKLTKLYGLF